MSQLRTKILCVDDEPHVLEGLALQLRRGYDVHTSTSGADGLKVLTQHGPFTAVLSDMRMPGMDGASFLSKARQQAPDTVRMLLTGQTGLESAIAAVNQGQIFRFLTKPCPPDQLRLSFEAATEQYRLVTAERVLLEQTLRGSVQTLSETLALANPVLFGRAQRVHGYVKELIGHLGVEESWHLDVAAMLSGLPYVTVPESTLQKVGTGQTLDANELEMVARFPEIVESLLSPIPRLETVRQILRYQHKNFDGSGIPQDSVSKKAIPLGSRMLKIATDYDALENRGMDHSSILETMAARAGFYDVDLLRGFAEARGAAVRLSVVELRRVELRPGMQIAQDIKAKSGIVIISRGHEVTPRLIQRLNNFASGVGVQEPLHMLVPDPDKAAV